MAARFQMSNGAIKIPAAILIWLNHNSHCRASDLVDSLVKAGHDSEEAKAWVWLYFSSKNQGNAELLDLKLRTDSGYFFPPGNFGPTFPNYLMLGEKRYPISMVCLAPRVLQILDVLTFEECDLIVEASRPSLTPSTVVSNTETNSTVAQNVRSSFGAFFPRGSHSVVKAIEERLSRLFCFPLSHAEPIQILNYPPNTEYKPHHDFFDENSAEGKRLVEKSGNRVATIIMYLNEVELGGATIFPKLNLQVLPRKGSILYFDYKLPVDTEDISKGAYDIDSLHGGAPVIAGEKWIATQWIRQLPYVG